MNRITSRNKRYTRRRRSVRKNIFGSPSRPRLTVTQRKKSERELQRKQRKKALKVSSSIEMDIATTEE